MTLREIDTRDHLPPHSIEAEMCLIASLMIDADFALQTLPTLSSESFFLADHKVIFDAIADLIRAGRPLDAVILRDELKKLDQLDRVGGSAYIAQILGTVPSAAHGPEYAQRVREHAALRSIISAANDVTRRAMTRQADAAQLAGELADVASGIMADRTSGEILTFAEAVTNAYDAIGEGGPPLIRTGLSELDAVIGGIGTGETVIAAGRPSMGKSTLARTIAGNVARSGTPVGLISLEEAPDKIARNALAGAAEIDNHRIRSADLRKEEWERLAKASIELQRLPICISRKARTVDQIRAVATTMKSKYGCRLIIVDHLSRVRAPGKSIYEQVTNASGALSDLVKDLGVAGLILCQLNRSVENRDDQRPNMSDLRDSGAIEQDADGILLLHREDYFRVRDPSYNPTSIAEVIVAKWRDGVRGKTIRIKSDLPYQRFVDLPPQSDTTHSPEDF